jgi:hypothetical protein
VWNTARHHNWGNSPKTSEWRASWHNTPRFFESIYSPILPLSWGRSAGSVYPYYFVLDETTGSHLRIVWKLRYYGIRNNTFLWIQDFLSHRTQEVQLEGHKSTTADVLSGVPQGTVLDLCSSYYSSTIYLVYRALIGLRLLETHFSGWKAICHLFSHSSIELRSFCRICVRAARFVTRNYHDRHPGSVTQMVQQLQWEPLQVRRIKIRLGPPVQDPTWTSGYPCRDLLSGWWHQNQQRAQISSPKRIYFDRYSFQWRKVFKYRKQNFSFFFFFFQVLRWLFIERYTQVHAACKT